MTPTRSPQLILTLDPAGEIIAERFINGARVQEKIFALAQVRALLFDHRDAIASEEAKEQEKIRAARVATHNANYRYIAIKHDKALAMRTVGAPIRPGPQPNAQGQDLSAREERAKVLTPEMMDL